MKADPKLIAAATAAVERLIAGLCPHCGEKIEEREVVGRCHYAKPCGHRIGQFGPAKKRRRK